MAFAASARIRVTSQKSDCRGRLGTVVRAAADTPHGFNEVRLDGSPVGGQVELLADGEMGTTNFPSPVEYD